MIDFLLNCVFIIFFIFGFAVAAVITITMLRANKSPLCSEAGAILLALGGILGVAFVLRLMK